MTRFAVELYVARGAALQELERRARVAATQLASEGRDVRYVRTMFLPGDETCFHLYDAASPALVEEASRRAGITFDRVVEAVER